MTERLTTLAALKDWLGITSTATDPTLTRLIDAVSQFIFTYLNRSSFQAQVYTQDFRGNGKNAAFLSNYPVIGITSVGIGGSSIPLSSAPVSGLPGTGYFLGDNNSGNQFVNLYGYNFDYGAPCTIVYTAGYQTTSSYILTVVNTAITFTPTDGGSWTKDGGVTINGVAATLVASAPAVGQYSVDAWGVYTFNIADAGKTAVVTYSYVPWDISWIAMEIAGEWYKRKDRIGLMSKTLGGQETITFGPKDLDKTMIATMQSYMNVVPM